MTSPLEIRALALENLQIAAVRDPADTDVAAVLRDAELEAGEAHDARFAAAVATMGRFAGRATLTRLADRSMASAGRHLADLRGRLGIAGPDEMRLACRAEVTGTLVLAARAKGLDAAFCLLLLAESDASRRNAAVAESERDAHEVAPSATSWVCRQIAGPEIDAIETARREEVRAELLRQGEAVRLSAAAEALRTLLAQRGFRRATHKHSRAIRLVPEGQEGAASTTGRAAAPSKAYARISRYVTTSDHVWSVSEAILWPETAALNAEGTGVWLSPTCHVEQGRGTALKVTRRSRR